MLMLREWAGLAVCPTVTSCDGVFYISPPRAHVLAHGWRPDPLSCLNFFFFNNTFFFWKTSIPKASKNICILVANVVTEEHSCLLGKYYVDSENTCLQRKTLLLRVSYVLSQDIIEKPSHQGWRLSNLTFIPCRNEPSDVKQSLDLQKLGLQMSHQFGNLRVSICQLLLQTTLKQQQHVKNNYISFLLQAEAGVPFLSVFLECLSFHEDTGVQSPSCCSSL